MSNNLHSCVWQNKIINWIHCHMKTRKQLICMSSKQNNRHVYEVHQGRPPNLPCALLIILILCVCVCADSHGFIKVLAKDSQSKRGDVSQRTGGDTGRHRAFRVCEGHGAPLPSARQVCVQPAFSGSGPIFSAAHGFFSLTVFCWHAGLPPTATRWLSERSTTGTTNTSWA